MQYNRQGDLKPCASGVDMLQGGQSKYLIRSEEQ